MPNHNEGPTHRTRFFWALGRRDAHLLNLEDVSTDHKCKETEKRNPQHAADHAGGVAVHVDRRSSPL